MIECSVIIPCYHCERTIKSLTERLVAVLDQMAVTWEIILVDDASGDSTGLIIKELARTQKGVWGVFLKKNVGQQNALLCGVRKAQGELIITIDDDLEYAPEEIPLLIERLNQGYDVVYGISESYPFSFFRKAGSFLKDFLFFLAFGKPFGIRLSSYRAMTKDVVKWVASDTHPSVYLSARILMKTKKIANCPVHRMKHEDSVSQYNYRKLLVLVFKNILAYRILPPKKENRSLQQYQIKEIIEYENDVAWCLESTD